MGSAASASTAGRNRSSSLVLAAVQWRLSISLACERHGRVFRILVHTMIDIDYNFHSSLCMERASNAKYSLGTAKNRIN